MFTNWFGSESQKTQSFLSGAVLPKPACFPGKEICMYVSEQTPAHPQRQKLQQTFCFARAERENVLPSYSASFGRL